MPVLLQKLCLACLAIPVVVYINLTYVVHQLIARIQPCPYPNASTYDFIVVGSGTAGSTVAGRLVEAGHSVLQIEAGGPSHWMQGLPAFVLHFQLSNYDWQYRTVPQERAGLALNGGISNWPRGKELGGSSMLNYMLYVRGHPKDYDEWEKMGNAGWGYKDVLPYFKKSENHKRNPAYDASMTGDRSDAVHGRGGPVDVETRPEAEAVHDVIIEAARELGHGPGDMATTEEGFAYHDAFLRDGWRMGTFRSYCEEYYNQGKLDVLTFSHVTKLLIDSSNRVTGIELDRFGQTFNFFAAKEVILSAGSIDSPQILMLSGIGPQKHLNDLGIPVKADLPVGSNLQDHLFSVIPAVTERPICARSFRSFDLRNWISLIGFNKGPLLDSTTGSMGFTRSPMAPNDGRPDLQFQFAAFSAATDYGLGVRDVLNMKQESFDAFYKKLLDKFTFVLLPSLLRPKSKGFIKLRSKDPFDYPIIDPKYLTDKQDLDTLTEGVAFIHKMAATDAFKEAGITLPKDEFNCGSFSGREYYECFAKHWTATIYHPVGTCKMGKVTDKETVVDSQTLKVKGVSGVRVIDASVMPKLVGGNTNAPTIMIAEKGVDMIIKEHGKGDRKVQMIKRDEL